jgi:hypothetical protein
MCAPNTLCKAAMPIPRFELSTVSRSTQTIQANNPLPRLRRSMVLNRSRWSFFEDIKVTDWTEFLYHSE